MTRIVISRQDVMKEQLPKAGPGRPSKATAADLARKFTRRSIRVLADIMLDESQKGAVRVAAANSLLDRGHGKSPLVIATEDADAETQKFQELFEASARAATQAMAAPMRVISPDSGTGTQEVLPPESSDKATDTARAMAIGVMIGSAFDK